MSYELPYFGSVDPEAIDEYYDVDVELDGCELSLDLNFDEESVSTAKLDKARVRLERLPALLEMAKTTVRESFEAGSDARKYIKDHIDLITAPELQEALGGTDGSLSAEERLFSLVHPVRIGLYPEDEEHYFTFDFSISEALTQYLIVVVLTVDEKLQYVTIES